MAWKFANFGFQSVVSRREGIKLAFSAVLAPLLRADQSDGRTPLSELTRSIPPRSPAALTGSQFAESVAHAERDERERAILNQLLDGNLPDFLRRLVPVLLEHKTPRGSAVAVTIFAMPEYLAIGPESDFLRIPMDLYTARAVADRFQFTLPTRKMVDAIYDQSPHHFTPQPLPAGPQMRSTEYYRMHNAMIDRQSQARGIPLGGLVSGHKKDVVLTNLLAARPTQIAIYGWHRSSGAPIQPLSTVHGAHYADYSHGIRLISQTALVNGERRSIHEILQDPTLAQALSDEGPLRRILEMWSTQRL